MASYNVNQRPPPGPYRSSSLYTLADAPAKQIELPARRTAVRTPRHGTTLRQ